MMTKKMIKISVFAFLTSLLITSCSIQSRVYNQGFHVNWKNNRTSVSDEDVSNSLNKEEEFHGESVVLASKAIELESLNAQDEEIHNSTNLKTSTKQLSAIVENRKSSAVKYSAKISNSVDKDRFNQLKRKKYVADKQAAKKGMSDEMILLTILCFLLPFVAVGIKTNWDLMMVLVALLLSFLFFIPGVIFALLVVYDKI
jgi:uncharacterized membrane protein YqaE (UPF0057 family)